jgi:hypothetical protein
MADYSVQRQELMIRTLARPATSRNVVPVQPRDQQWDERDAVDNEKTFWKREN